MREDEGRPVPGEPEDEGHAAGGERAAAPRAVPEGDDPFARPENEDDDGYDPWSDRAPRPDPLFERDPWG